MEYEIYKQKPIGANVPQLNQKWEHVCDVENDKEPADFDLYIVVKALTGESLVQQSAKCIWWKAIKK